MRIVFIFLLCASLASAQTVRHVVPTGGVTSGEGTSVGIGWTPAWSGNTGNAADPGDTIYYHDGTYTLAAALVLNKDGTAGNPIIYRNYPGDTVNIVPATGEDAIQITADYVWVWGFQINRPTGEQEEQAHIYPQGTGNKVINCVLKNSSGNTVAAFRTSKGFEMYGNIVLYSGNFWVNWPPVQKRAYSIYTQNAVGLDGLKYITDNVFAWPWSFSIHAYSESDTVQGYVVRGNTTFNAQWLDKDGAGYSSAVGFIRGGTVPPDSIVYAHNYQWHGTDGSTAAPQLYWNYDAANAITNSRVDSNILIGAYSTWALAGTTFDSNVKNVYGTNWLPATLDESYTDNTWITDRASLGDTAIVRMNAYESKRAHLIVFNHDAGDSVSVNPTGFTTGDTLTLKNVQNLEDTPFTKVYAGTAFNVPMAATRWTIETPVTSYDGLPTGALTETFPSFGVFLITGVAESAPAYTAPVKRVPWTR